MDRNEAIEYALCRILANMCNTKDQTGVCPVGNSACPFRDICRRIGYSEWEKLINKNIEILDIISW